MSSLCTRAITGAEHPALQEIFICDTCHGDDVGNNPPLPSCICISCAEICHSNHEVQFVGVGPCTCDCGEEGKCQLAEHSAEEARRLGYAEPRSLNDPIPLKVPPPLSELATGCADDNEEEKERDSNADDNEKEDGPFPQSMTNLSCIESSLGGYTYAAYTLPSLAINRGELCHKLVGQAEVLAETSRDTFWLPDGIINEGGGKDNNKWCDLEILAMQIYKHHVQSNPMNAATGSSGGAEWWVQVKPVGTSRAPVDLHYDKDEVLAENFGLGSFPTLSTVTYLTENDDNVPTIIFPHTYNDEEDSPIRAMLLSHPVKAKHLVFDGRLLHGAPAHQALLRNSEKASNSGEKNSLRVTFLMNIWRSGRPAGVDILPEPIRAKTRSAVQDSDAVSSVPLEFQQRHVSTVTVPVKSSQSSDEKIVLPFVSHGATWIGEAEAEDEAKNSDVVKGEGGGNSGEDGGRNKSDEEDSNEEEEDGEDDDELVLVLPSFATPEYIADKADTIVISFASGNGARLVRGALDEATVQDCPWKKLFLEEKSE